MNKQKRIIIKRLRFTPVHSEQLEIYLDVHGIRFTNLIHLLIKRELNKSWPNVARQVEQELEDNSVAHQSNVKRRRSNKNLDGRPIPRADPILLLELGRIGNNINQIARSLNFLCLKQNEDIQQFSFLDCIDILSQIQIDLHQHLPSIPEYLISDALATRRRAKATHLVYEIER